MTKSKRDNPAQSAKFVALAKELEAAGNLSPTDGAKGLERVLKAAKAKKS